MRYLCLDTGGTGIKYAICSESGQVVHAGKAVVGDTLEAFLDSVEALYKAAAPVQGIACSFPGEVHSREDIICGISAVEHLHGHPICKLISQRCDGVRVTMINDANAAALGELWLGVGKDYRNMAFVIVGSGVGGAVIENGTLYPGTTHNKAEIGNFPLGGMQNGKLLSWSDFTLEKEARKYSQECGTRINGETLIERAENGDQKAARYVDEFLYYMALGCIYVEFAYDPEVIVIGGGFSENKKLIDDINRYYRKLVKGQRMEYQNPAIVACKHANRANLFGALYYHLNYEQ